MKEVVRKTAKGALIYDADRLPDIGDALFHAGRWQRASPVTGRLKAAGRGNTMIVAGDEGEFVLRHFMRGGLIGRLVSDSYLWLGEDATRSFGEWRLLKRLVAENLPVPQPAAARYVRSGPIYRADLLTVRIPGVTALSERIAGAPYASWRDIGATIARFHEAGVCHADLNAYNIQIDEDGGIWLIDFDRGRLRDPGSWQQSNLGRLHRSLEKIKGLDPALHFQASDWEQLVAGYRGVYSSA